MDNLYTHQIIPGILEKEWAEIEKKVELVKAFSKKFHIDVIDGKFAPNQTFLDPTPFLKYANELYLEAHLMVEEPVSYLDSFAKAGFRKFIGHVEKMTSQEEFVAKGELLGEVGLGLDLDTPVENITSSFEDLDSVLLMAVKAGESGQTFDPKVLEKIKNLRSKTFIPIEVDGGINDQTIVGCKDAGANIFVSTSYISQDLRNYSKLQKLLQI